MTNRKDWPLALSVGPTAMNAASFDALAAAGIHQVELSSGQYAPYYDLLDFPHRAEEIVKLAAAHDVRITSIHLPFSPFTEIDPASADPAIRAKFLSIQSELLEVAASAGIPLAIVHPSGEPYPEEERPQRLAWAIESIGALCAKASSLGMTLCLENLPRTCLCRTSDEMLQFRAAIPELKVVFDTNHSLTEDNVHYIHAVGSKIVSLHVSDYDFIDERHLLPSEGLNPWSKILEALEEEGYNGRFLYELKEGYSYTQVAENYRSLI